jgi:flagellar hook assembly protein FlgD
VRGETRISFALADPAYARVAIYNVAGRRVRVLVEQELPAGEQSVVWNTRDDAGRLVTPGIYFARLETRDADRSRKLVVAGR